MVAQEKLLTAEEFGKLPNDDDKKFELDEGVLVEVSPTKPRHTVLQGVFTYFLTAFIRTNNLVGVFGPELGCRLTPKTVRVPDVAFVSEARLSNPNLDEFIPLGPDLVIEIISPSDTAREINKKIRQYFDAGSRLIWIVYPDDLEVYVYSGSRTNVKVINIEGVLDGEDVLPGFTLSMRDIFKGLTNEE